MPSFSIDVARTPGQIGAAIRAARHNKGWSQAELAVQSGTLQKIISRIETGHGGTRIDTVLRVISVLGLDLLIAPRDRTPDILPNDLL